MADISPDQYVKYDKWVRRGGKKPTALQQAQVDRLKELDDQCKRCLQFPDHDMRCEGTRLVFQEPKDDEPHLSRLAMESCRKLDLRVSDKVYADRLKRSLVPPRVVQEIVAADSDRVNCQVVRKGDRLCFDGKVLQDLAYETHYQGLDVKVKEYIVAMANCGFQGVYLYTVDFYRAWVSGKSRIANIKEVQSPLLDCDWLVIEAIDFSTEATYFREALFTVARTRASQLKPLMVIQTRNKPQWQSEMERDFFEEATRWPKLALP